MPNVMLQKRHENEDGDGISASPPPPLSSIASLAHTSAFSPSYMRGGSLEFRDHLHAFEAALYEKEAKEGVR